MRPAAIIVLAKEPVAGKVKTRCSPPCTPHQAADLARAALVDTLRTVRFTAAGRFVLALDGEAGSWLIPGYEVVPQGTGTLGERIDRAFADIGEPALLIGMDTPQVDVATLNHALDAVARMQIDSVVGPSADGGFWAIGLPKPVAGLCAAVPMSRPDTYNHLRSEIARRELSCSTLDELVDVDDFATALSVAAKVPRSAFAKTVNTIAASIDHVQSRRSW